MDLKDGSLLRGECCVVGVWIGEGTVPERDPATGRLRLEA